MNHPSHCKGECPDRDRHGYVQRSQTRRVAQPKMLVRNMRCVRAAADHPRRESPCTQVIGGQGEQSADQEVDDAEKERRAKPCLIT